MFGFTFTYLLAISGSLGGWLYPFFGLMVYYAFSILRPTALWFWAFDRWNPPRFSLYVGLATLVGWGVVGFGKASPLKYVFWPMLGLALYLASGTLAAALCELPRVTLVWDALFIQVKIGVMALVTVTLIRDEKQIKTFAWVVVVSLGYLAYNFNVQYLSWPQMIHINGFGGVDNNGTAMIMVCGVPLAFFMGLNHPKWYVKVPCFLSVLMLAHVVLFSFSRGGQVGLCIVGLLVFIVALVGLPNKMFTILVAIGFLSVTLYLAGPEVRERFQTVFSDPAERDVSAASRFTTWSAAWECMKDHPLGVGPRAFNSISGRYGLTENKSVHNLFLQTGADYGFGGMIGLALFYAGSMWSTFRMAFTRTAGRLRWPRYFGHMVCISLAGFITCSQFIGVETVEIAYIVSLLGLATVAYVREREQEVVERKPADIPELAEVPHPTALMA